VDPPILYEEYWDDAPSIVKKGGGVPGSGPRRGVYIPGVGDIRSETRRGLGGSGIEPLQEFGSDDGDECTAEFPYFAEVKIVGGKYEGCRGRVMKVTAFKVKVCLENKKVQPYLMKCHVEVLPQC
jgi:hypothetical protein